MNHVFDSVIKKTHNKAFGVALNYYAPDKNIAKPHEPLIFTKSLSALTQNPSVLRLASPSKINHEVELGVMIGKTCYQVDKKDALDYVGGYFLLLDLTANVINTYRKEGKSFCLTKNGDGFFVVGDFIEKSKIPDPHNINLELKVNSKVTQAANSKLMIYNVNDLIAYLSKFFTLNPGDLILSGTPDGIATFESGDLLEAKMTNSSSDVLGELKVKINYDIFDSKL